jgi:hypothetical protein
MAFPSSLKHIVGKIFLEKESLVAFYCYFFCLILLCVPLPLTNRYKAKVCCRSPAGIVGSNLAWGMDVFLL